MPAPQHVKQLADEARAQMARPAPAAPETEEPTPVEKPVDEKPARRPDYVDPSDWEKRFKLLRANREERVVDLQSQLSTALSTIESLKRQVAELQPPPPQEQGFRVSDGDREMLGETGSEVVEQVAKYVDSSLAKSKAEEEERLRIEQQKKTERFLDGLTSLVPTWREHCKTSQFDIWLKNPDPATGMLRERIFNNGIDDLDASTVGDLLNSYLDERHVGSQNNPLQEPSPEPEIRSTEATGDVYYEWFGANEIQEHFTEKTAMQRKGKTSGPAWDAVMERQARIDVAMKNNRIMEDK